MFITVDFTYCHSRDFKALFITLQLRCATMLTIYHPRPRRLIYSHTLNVQRMRLFMIANYPVMRISVTPNEDIKRAINGLPLSSE